MPSRSSSIVRLPPPPYSSVLRAISLAAVTIFVRSTNPMPTARHHPRTTWRTLTMSCGPRTAMRSVLDVSIVHLEHDAGGGDCRVQQRHPFLHIERGAHARQREAELHQRDRDRRLHPDDDGVGIEHARD